jgi:hypothetical protein
VAPVSLDLDAVTQLAGTDRRAARQLLGAQQTQAATAAKIAAADADADRRLRVARQQRQLAAEDRATRHRDEQQAIAHRDQRRAQQAEQSRQQWRARRATLTRAVGVLGDRADDAYAATMYALAVGGAIYGQITAATGRDWPLAAGLVIAAAIEGLALVMALTAQKLRLAGEAARAPRALTWICAVAAATINYFGHARADQVGAVLLAALSLAGIIVWEIRSGAAHRVELRARSLLPDPPVTFGWRRWLRFPRSTLAAWSLDVRDRVSPRAARLLETAAAEHHQRRVGQEQARIRRLARRTVRRATRRGHYADVLTALTRLAEHGTLAGVPDRTALPRTAAADTHRPPRWPAPVSMGLAATDTGQHSPERPRRTRPRPLPHGRARRGPRLRPRRAPTAAPRSTAPARPAGTLTARSDDHPTESEPNRPERDPAISSQASQGTSAAPRGAGGPPPAEPGQTATDGVSSGGATKTGAIPSPAVARPPSASTTRQAPSRASAPPTPSGNDVTNLLSAGRKIRDELTAAGVVLSRSVLTKALREQNIPIGPDQATALLTTLRRESTAARR